MSRLMCDGNLIMTQISFWKCWNFVRTKCLDFDKKWLIKLVESRDAIPIRGDDVTTENFDQGYNAFRIFHMSYFMCICMI